MCGITFSLSQHELPSELYQTLCNVCRSRGPDYQGGTLVKHVSSNLYLHFYASVLHLRGDHVARQPFRDNDDVLIYNGEIFDGIDLSSDQNDGEELFRLLQTSASPLLVLPKIEGPYAFVYYKSTSQQLYWARDPLGRRSLLHTTTPTGDFLLSSASCAISGLAWQEVDASCVHSLDLARHETARPICHSRVHRKEAGSRQDIQIYPFDPLSTQVPGLEEVLLKSADGLPTANVHFDRALESFQIELEASISKRVCDIPRLNGPAFPKARVGVLFSGGLDCTVIALLADKFLPEQESIDLLNVAFENPRSIANAAKSKMHDGYLHDVYNTPDRLTGIASAKILKELRPKRQWNFVAVNVPYSEFLEEREHIIQLMQPNNTIMDLSITQALYFAAKGTGSIETERNLAEAYQSEAKVLLSGLGADEQLGGYSRHKKAFSSGTSSASTDQVNATGWPALIQELQLDLDRLNSRNLGRDDRIISSLGKEVRYPYLAGHVVAYLASLPIHLKADYSFGDGIGDKMLLRALARRLGLQSSAFLAKRAIQFGARSAKMELDSRGTKGDSLLV